MQSLSRTGTPPLRHGQTPQASQPAVGAPSTESWGPVQKVVSAAPFVCGTSSLGNLYRVLDHDTKAAICREWFRLLPKPVVVDTAGKYGAGLALEELGNCLRELGVSPDDVVISNKLAWRRTPLLNGEPTFEPGLWEGLQHDAELAISHDGMLHCWEEGCRLLGGDFRPRLVSVHDPDDFMNAATSPADADRRC